MIHGSKRTKHKKTEQQIKDQEQLSEKINLKLGQFFTIPRTDVNPLQIPKYLQFIALLMQLVSDIPTVFNLRRELIEASIAGKQQQQIGKILAGQIKLTTKLIQADTKSYTMWTYRQWIIKSLFKINPQVIKAEKELIKMLLMKDQKNFHVWNYRNWLNSVQSSINQDIEFTQQKIKSNPFNFSPYHFRSKFIYQKYSETLKQSQLQPQKRKQILIYGMPKEFFLQELERVKTAIFLNPKQQAPWLYYNWLLGQLVPALIISQQKKEGGIQVLLNMKTGDFLSLIEGQNVSIIGKTGKNNSDIWHIKFTGENIKFNSNLDKPFQSKLQSTGRLFLAQHSHQQIINDNIKSIFTQELRFLDEVIESEEEEKCRFAYLQKASIYKFILSCGTTEAEFSELVKQGLQTLKSIQTENKANKYIKKQIQYWQRLSRNQLNAAQKGLKSMYS